MANGNHEGKVDDMKVMTMRRPEGMKVMATTMMREGNGDSDDNPEVAADKGKSDANQGDYDPRDGERRR